MITSLQVKNFKALRDVTVPLGPFTVLIGPNDTGKSSFLEAVYALSQSTTRPLAHCFWSDWEHLDLVHGQSPTVGVDFKATLVEPAFDDVGPQPNDGLRRGTGEIEYALEVGFLDAKDCTAISELVKELGVAAFGPDYRGAKTPRTALANHAKNPSQTPLDHAQQFDTVRSRLGAPFLARWDVEQLARVGRVPSDRNCEPFDSTGFGLATCLADLKLFDDKRFSAIRERLCKMFDGFRDISFEPAVGPQIARRNRFQRDVISASDDCYAVFLNRTDGVRVPASAASGGVLIALAFLTLIHLPEKRNLLLIEEPENGLHPGLLREVVEVLRSAVEQNAGTQVIMTTHSPLLLDYVQPDEVRVFLRNDASDVEVFNVADVPDITDRLKYLMLGELVYNEGEAELVREIRQHASTDPG